MGVERGNCKRFTATLGNLLLLSMSINSALQNDSFEGEETCKARLPGEENPQWLF